MQNIISSFLPFDFGAKCDISLQGIVLAFTAHTKGANDSLKEELSV